MCLCATPLKKYWKNSLRVVLIFSFHVNHTRSDASLPSVSWTGVVFFSLDAGAVSCSGFLSFLFFQRQSSAVSLITIPTSTIKAKTEPLTIPANSLGSSSVWWWRENNAPAIVNPEGGGEGYRLHLPSLLKMYPGCRGGEVWIQVR